MPLNLLDRVFISGVFLVIVFAGINSAQADEATGRESAITVPTPLDVVNRMLELAKVTDRDVLYDLGCGDGRIVVAAAKQFGCRAVGYDINPLKIKQSKERVKNAGVGSKVRIENQDIFTLDLTQASVVTLYLLPSMNDRLVPQLKRMKPGSRVVCHDFPIDALKPQQTLTIESKETDAPHTIYLYVIQ